tara:strand:+ start:3943 stop:4236 length:294 start_codon:yes stop_codon:yes gene_type:complete
MAIDIKTLQDERVKLKSDFDMVNGRIKQVESDLGTMKSNLNALYGAIQQVDKLIKLEDPKAVTGRPVDGEKDNRVVLNEKDKAMPADKQAALNVATT